MGPNTELRAQRAAKEVTLPTGPRLCFDDLAKRYGITLEQLASMVDREKRRTDLNARERECLISYASGEKIDDTAAKICLSPKTINVYLNSCGQKLGLRSRIKALHYCILAGWIEPGDGLSDEARASAEKQRNGGEGE